MTEETKTKLVKISFDSEKLQIFDDTKSIYGIAVEKKGDLFFGKCDPESKKALLDAGKCEK